MRILFLLADSGPGSAQTNVLNLLRGLRDVHDTAIAVGESGSFTDAVRKLGVPCHILPTLAQAISLVKDLRAIMEVARLIRSGHFDLVHAHEFKAGLIGRLAARVAGVPSVYTAHTWTFSKEAHRRCQLAVIPMERIAGRFCSAIINVSSADRDLALRHRIAPVERMPTIWNGIPDSRHRARPGAARVPEVMTVYRADHEDHSVLIRALAGIRLPARAVFVGDSSNVTRLAEVAKLTGIPDRVRFVRTPSDVAPLLSRAHVFALPVHSESSLLTILEAMRAGLPVVAPNAGGIPEAVVDRETGFLIEPKDETALFECLRILLAEPSLRRRMGNAGRELYESRFTLRHMVDKTTGVYQTAIRSFRAHRTAAPPRPHEREEEVLYDA